MKTRIAKILGWIGAFSFYAQQAIAQQSVLPHNLKGWISLVGSFVVGFAFHHAASTDGVK